MERGRHRPYIDYTTTRVVYYSAQILFDQEKKVR